MQVDGVYVKRRETIRNTPTAAWLDSPHASAKAALTVSPVTALGGGDGGLSSADRGANVNWWLLRWQRGEF